MAAGEAELFAARIRWAREAMTVRQVPSEDLRVGIECLAETLQERLPRKASSDFQPFLEAALRVFDEEVENETLVSEPRSETDRIALEYMVKALEGDSVGAVRFVESLVEERGLEPQEVYSGVLMAAQRRVGEMWHAGEVSIAEEHLVTTTTRQAMSRIADHLARTAVHGRTVIVGAVATDAHDLGVRATADFFDAAGWRAICLGSDVPAPELADAARAFAADLVVISATLVTHLKHARESIAAVQETQPTARILVGGAAFDQTPWLWRRLGADGYAPSTEVAVSLGADLVGLKDD